MRKKEIKNLDRLETNGRESGQMTEKAGRKGYLKKSSKASSRRRRQQNERENAAKKQRKDSRLPAFKLADLLPDETIKKLRGIENGRTNLKRPTSRK